MRSLRNIWIPSSNARTPLTKIIRRELTGCGSSHGPIVDGGGRGGGDSVPFRWRRRAVH